MKIIPDGGNNNNNFGKNIMKIMNSPKKPQRKNKTYIHDNIKVQ